MVDRKGIAIFRARSPSFKSHRRVIHVMPGSKVILIDGDPKGIRIVTIANRAGFALASYRPGMARLLERLAIYFSTREPRGMKGHVSASSTSGDTKKSIGATRHDHE